MNPPPQPAQAAILQGQLIGLSGEVARDGSAEAEVDLEAVDPGHPRGDALSAEAAGKLLEVLAQTLDVGRRPSDAARCRASAAVRTAPWGGECARTPHSSCPAPAGGRRQRAGGRARAFHRTTGRQERRKAVPGFCPVLRIGPSGDVDSSHSMLTEINVAVSR